MLCYVKCIAEVPEVFFGEQEAKANAGNKKPGGSCVDIWVYYPTRDPKSVAVFDMGESFSLHVMKGCCRLFMS